jgi:hypothetical protein
MGVRASGFVGGYCFRNRLQFRFPFEPKMSVKRWASDVKGLILRRIGSTGTRCGRCPERREGSGKNWLGESRGPVLAKGWKLNSVVHSQPAGSGENALGYLSAYIFKTATANRVVTLLPNGKVRWPYRDSNTRWPAAIDLEPDQLISRFLQHVLPPHFCRVRLFGWLHPAAKVRANRVRALLGEKALLTPEELRTWQPPPDQKGQPPLQEENTPPASTPLCPRCGQPMKRVQSWKTGQMPPALWPKARPPP